jgi:hypothetical protein
VTNKVFVDTNVLVYTRDACEPQEQKRAMGWMSHLWNLRTGRLSFQVPQGYYEYSRAPTINGLLHFTHACSPVNEVPYYRISLPKRDALEVGEWI